MSFSKELLPPKNDEDAIRGGPPPQGDWGPASLPPKKRASALPRIVAVAVVILFCLTAIGLLVPAVSGVRRAAFRMATSTNMNQLAMAVHTAHDTTKTIPPYNGPHAQRLAAPYTFHVHVMAYIEASPLNLNPADGANATISVFLSSLDTTSAGGLGVTNFPVNLRLFYTDGGLGTLDVGIPAGTAKPPSFKQITDGLSNTLLLATTYQNCGAIPKATSNWLDPEGLSATFGKSMAMWQQAPAKSDCIANGTAVSLTPDAIQVVFCDRNTRNLTPEIGAAVWAAIHTPGGGEPNHDIGN